MERLAAVIVDKRNIIFLIFAALAIFCAFSRNWVEVCDDITAYLPDNTETRTGLDLNTRELLTFAIVSALGGCEAQVKAHVQGNANVGNSKQTLIDTLAQMLPYIGFPRTLNALGCVNTVLQD